MEPKHLIVKDRSEAFTAGEHYEGLPHGWVQWKNTDVCMDFHCKCGFQGHFDGYFAYELQCPICKTIYSLNGHIQFIEVIKPEYPEHVKKVEIESDDLDTVVCPHCRNSDNLELVEDIEIHNFGGHYLIDKVGCTHCRKFNLEFNRRDITDDKPSSMMH